MARAKKCKQCKSALGKEEHKLHNYTIIISRCKCRWDLVDVLSSDGESLKSIMGKDVIERMLKSKMSNIKF